MFQNVYITILTAWPKVKLLGTFIYMFGPGEAVRANVGMLDTTMSILPRLLVGLASASDTFII